MRVAVAQIPPVFLQREATLDRVAARVEEAAAEGAALVAFGEALVPGYPVWLSRTDGARFDCPEQKAWHARYLEQGVDVDAGHLDGLVGLSRDRGIAIVLGFVERPRDRGGHSLYCSLGVILPERGLASVHRKLVPTYEERLAWGAGDGAGLVTHPLGPFTLGALNCWENWMPLARAALHAAGEDLHVMLWPGSVRLTRDITRLAAIEGRSFVVSAGALLRPEDVPEGLPGRAALLERVEPGQAIHDGGSCIAAPDGRWIVEPVAGEEGLIVADLDPAEVGRERQNFDASGHYARPDVLRLRVDRRRHRSSEWID